MVISRHAVPPIQDLLAPKVDLHTGVFIRVHGNNMCIRNWDHSRLITYCTYLSDGRVLPSNLPVVARRTCMDTNNWKRRGNRDRTVLVRSKVVWRERQNRESSSGS